MRLKNPERERECRRVLLAIQIEGGPDKIGEHLREEGSRLKLIVQTKGKFRYTLKANRMRGRMIAEAGDRVTGCPPKEGAVADVLVCGHQLRGRVTGVLPGMMKVECWHAGKWETIGVEAGKLTEVDPKTL